MKLSDHPTVKAYKEQKSQSIFSPAIFEAAVLKQMALDAGAERILLDNMNPRRLRRAVEINKGRAKLEASGGVSLKNIRAIAETGVNFISVGRITQSAPAVDIGLDLDVS